MALHKVCKQSEISSGEGLRVETTPAIAVFNVEGAFYAVADRCTHAEASLADGYMDRDTIECPLHGAKFCLKTGEVLCQPASESLQSFPVVLRDGLVFVDV
ncbi:MAG: bifunctional 3-phenylpropionate/cinnamic acid dioxygenase ferredoxin subunit [Acidobacteriota bacterium]|nr:bifunctional 3-phenylpropionate/cinnamic acid dioxygenase ferredoxin subunit [Acidobacteriota bacterium]